MKRTKKLTWRVKASSARARRRSQRSAEKAANHRRHLQPDLRRAAKRLAEAAPPEEQDAA